MKLSRLMSKASFPQIKTFNSYCFGNITFLNNSNKENLLMIGVVSTGKTYLAIAIGLEEY